MFGSNHSQNQHFLVVLGIIFLLGGIVFVGTTFFLCNYDDIIRYIIETYIVLEKPNEFFQLWSVPPLSFVLRAYLFNITNVEEFPWQNSKPQVEQVGPYVFKETWERSSFQWYENNTLSYLKNRTFKFDPESSVGPLDDMIINFNVPIFLVASYIKSAHPLIRLMATSTLHLMDEPAFIKKSARELLFEGYEDNVIKVGKHLIPNLAYDRFAYLYGKNQSTEERYTIFSGSGDTIRKIGQTDRYNEKDFMDMWDGDICDKVRGTDGSSFAPILNPMEDLEIFHPYVCRSLNLSFANTFNIFGVDVYKYELGIKNFDNGSLIPENKCYCPEENCLKSGTLYLGPCYYGIPIYASPPHFFEADKSYLKDFSNLKPDKFLHSSYIYVEPLSGIPLNVSAKLQLNLLIQPIPNFGILHRAPTMLFPLMWFEEAGTVPEDTVEDFKNHLFVPLHYVKIVTYILFITGIITIFLAPILFIRHLFHHSTTKYANPPT